jgi:non-ribosomal peptide synthetase component F
MRDHMPLFADLPPDQQAIRATCVHPTGTFIPFEPAAIEQSIPDRFEQQVASYPDRLAVKTRSHALPYAALNHAANGVAHALLTQHGPRSEPIALLLDTECPVDRYHPGSVEGWKNLRTAGPFFPHARLRSIVRIWTVEALSEEEVTRRLTDGGGSP